MRKAFAIALGACFLCAAGLCAQSLKGKTMSVQNQTAVMRASPSFTAKTVVKLEYGKQTVLVLEDKGAWVRAQITGAKTEGWIAKSDLTTKRVVLSSGGATKTGVDTKEVALAGKGFNKEVEAQYKADGKVDYSWVDKMETFKASPDECMAFLKASGLPKEEAK